MSTSTNKTTRSREPTTATHTHKDSNTQPHQHASTHDTRTQLERQVRCAVVLPTASLFLVFPTLLHTRFPVPVRCLHIFCFELLLFAAASAVTSAVVSAVVSAAAVELLHSLFIFCFRLLLVVLLYLSFK